MPSTSTTRPSIDRGRMSFLPREPDQSRLTDDNAEFLDPAQQQQDHQDDDHQYPVHRSGNSPNCGCEATREKRQPTYRTSKIIRIVITLCAPLHETGHGCNVAAAMRNLFSLLPQGYGARREGSIARTAFGSLLSKPERDELVEQLAATTSATPPLESTLQRKGCIAK